MTDCAIVRILCRFAAFGSLVFGVFTWIFHSFGGRSAFAAYQDMRSVAPEYVFALPLIVGAFLYVLGEFLASKGLKFVGLLTSCAVYVSAFISCWVLAFNSTGVPNYFFVSGVYLLLAVCVAAKTEEAPT